MRPAGAALTVVLILGGPPAEAGFGAALRRTLQEPGTWVPAAGAAVFAATSWDGRLSRWAVTETPLFGSPEDAASASNDLRAASNYAMWGSVFLVSDPQRPWTTRLKTLAVEELGRGTTTVLTSLTKQAADRPRPDHSDNESFPSAHASQAFAYAAGTSWNLRHARLAPAWQRAGIVVADTLAGTTAWARVEAGVHYPSDVLAGAALGHFVTSAFTHAWLEQPQARSHVALDVDPVARTFRLRASF